MRIRGSELLQVILDRGQWWFHLNAVMGLRTKEVIFRASMLKKKR